MINKNILRGSTALFAAIVLSVGVSACGDSLTPRAEITKTAPTSVVFGIEVKAIYFSNGTRELELNGRLNKDNNYGIYPENIFEFCDGHNLVEELLHEGGNSNSLDRSVNYMGCSDGKSTPADVQLGSNSQH